MKLQWIIENEFVGFLIFFLLIFIIKVPLELLGHAQQILHRAMYSYGEDAPCYSAPRMLEEALKTDLRCDDFKDWSYSIESVDGSSIIRHHGIKLDQSEDEKWIKVIAWSFL